MGLSKDFRAGQRVRVRVSADSDFAGHYGVIMHVGTDVCDVRIRYKPKGSSVSSTYIGTFHKDDLESLQKPVDLALFGAEDGQLVRRQTWLIVGTITVIFIAGLWFFVQ